MPKLHLVAITPDNKGLVLSEQAESNRGDLVLDIDDRLLDAIDRAQRQRARDEGQKLSSAALPSRRESPETAAARPSPRQIQERLRAGETVAAVAKSAGIDEEWVERFAPPVLAELEQVAARARALTFAKPRGGRSQAALAASVAANLADRGIEMTDDEVEANWSAYQRPGDDWTVVFSFPLKGRRQKAEWSLDPTTGDLVARNKLATELGFRESTTRSPAAPKSPAKTAAKASPKAAAKAAAAPPAVAEDALAEPADAAGLGVTGLEVPGEAGDEPDDGIQQLPGTVDPTGELDEILDSVGIAPAPPSEPEPATAASAEPEPAPSRPLGETDPTMEVSLPSRPAPAPVRSRPQAPKSSSS